MSRLKKVAKTFVDQADKAKMSELTDSLLNDLASMQVVYNQTKMLHWISSGENYIEVHHFFDRIAITILQKIDLLAERIVYLGATPVNESSQVSARSYVTYGRLDSSFDQSAAMTTVNDGLDRVINGLRLSYTKAEEILDIGTSQLAQEILFELESLQHHVDSFRNRFTSTLQHDIYQPKIDIQTSEKPENNDNDSKIEFEKEDKQTEDLDLNNEKDLEAPDEEEQEIPNIPKRDN